MIYATHATRQDVVAQTYAHAPISCSNLSYSLQDYTFTPVPLSGHGYASTGEVQHG